MKVLITGAAGNLGSHLQGVGKEHGHDIISVTRSNVDQIDDLIVGSDLVIHAAGDITSSIQHDLVNVAESNLLLTTRALEACFKHKVRRFFYISSCAVYGNASSSKEVGDYQPLSLNGKFKKLNEELVSQYCQYNGIESTSFRLFNIYGGSDRFSLLSHLQRCSKHGQTFKIINGGVSQRDFIHVTDAAEIIIRCSVIDSLPSILNIGTGVAFSVMDILNTYLKKCPELKLEHLSAEEVEYSRADTRLLTELIGEYSFRNILDEVTTLD